MSTGGRPRGAIRRLSVVQGPLPGQVGSMSSSPSAKGVVYEPDGQALDHAIDLRPDLVYRVRHISCES